MKLTDKGPIMPPPILSAYPQEVSAEIQRWKNIIAATHWDLYDAQKVDGSDFYVGDEELGHIHLDGDVHLPAGRELYRALLANDHAKKFPYGGKDEGWVLFNIGAKKDVAHALWMFKLNYDRLCGVPIETLLKRIEAAMA